MSNRKIERGKVIVQNVANSIFDVRQVPKYTTDKKTDKKRVETSSLCLFIGKNNVKSGFKSVQEAANFVAQNIRKYNKKTRKFS